MSTLPGQLELPSLPPFQRHSPTSRAAALAVYEKLPRRRREVMAYIAEHGPVTDEQIAIGLGLSGDSVRPRRIELFEHGLIMEDGVATTRAGNPAVTWKAVTP